MYQAGVQIETICKVLQHSTPAITLRYIGIEKQDIQDTYTALELQLSNSLLDATTSKSNSLHKKERMTESNQEQQTPVEDSAQEKKWYKNGWLWGGVFVLGGIGAAMDDQPGGSGSSAPSSYLQKDAIACYTEGSFDRQMTLLANGGKQLIRGCTVTQSRIKVALDDMSFFSGKTSVITMDGRTLWTALEMVD